MFWIVLALLGLAAGLLGGLFGIGGAVVVIPALVYILGFDQKVAQGTTLWMMVPPIGILAAWQYYKGGDADIKSAGVLALFFLIGGFFGGKLAVKLDPTLMRKGFAIFLAITAVRMFFK